MSNSIFEIFQDAQGKYKFRLRSTNSKIFVVGEGYKTKSDCIRGINELKEHYNAPVKDLTIGETTLVLDVPPKKIRKGSTIAFSGRLYGNDRGQGAPRVKINILESDGSVFKETFLASGITNLNGDFSIQWNAKKMDWWDNSVEIYANFEGNSSLKPSVSEKHSISICK